MIKTKPTDSPIVKRLKTQERAMLKLLGEYEDKLTRTAQIILRLKVEVQWSKIMRFSTTSNFAMITGIGTIPKGEKINGKALEEDKEIPVSLTLLLEMLDDGSTPYQLAEASQALVTVAQVLGPEEFHNFLKDETSDMEKIQALLPKLNETHDEQVSDHTQAETDDAEAPEAIQTPEKERPEIFSGFDTSGLDDSQVQSYRLSYLTNYIRTMK